MNTDLLEQFLAYLSIEKGLRPTSLEAYRRDLQEYLAFLEEKKRPATDPAIDGPMTLFMVHLHDRGLSPRSLARKSSALRGFYKFLVREGFMLNDPTEILERPRIGRPLPKVLTMAEIESILAQPDLATAFGLRDKAMLEVLYGTGIRESELIGLHMGSLNRDGEFLTVIGKGDRERVVPVGGYAVKAIDDYLQRGRATFLKDVSERTLFLNPYGKPVSRMGVWKIVRKYVLKAGIAKPVSPHTFRHSCATHMLEGGASILAVQEMLGHVDVATTQIYTHLTRNDLKKIHKEAHPRGK